MMVKLCQNNINFKINLRNLPRPHIFYNRRGLIFSHFCTVSQKFYKVTFSGLDKFCTNEQIKNSLDLLNEVKIHRTNKSTNKNYCHVDVISNLNIDQIRQKLEGIKILGKMVKVRVKEYNEETAQVIQKNVSNNILDIDQLDCNGTESRAKLAGIVKEFIHNFYIKNLTDNPVHVKKLWEQIEEIEKTSSDEKYFWIDVKDYSRKLFELEYNLQVIKESKRKFKIKDIQNHSTFLPIKTLSLLDADPEFQKENKNIKLICEKLEKIFSKLEYASYDPLTNKGVLRNLQIKFMENQYLVTLMISVSSLTEIDLKIISEAIKFEFKNIPDVSFYLSINEKVQALVTNSSLFYFLKGNLPYLEIKVDNNFQLLKLYPHVNENVVPLYFKNENGFEFLNIKNIFATNIFDNIIDFSSSQIPLSTLLKVDCKDKYHFLKEKNEFSIYNFATKENLLNLDNGCDFVKNTDKLEIYEKIDEISKYLQEKEEFGGNLSNLLIINLRNNLLIKGIKIEKLLSKSKYHLIISHSLPQILDFLKNYSNNAKNFDLAPKLKKLIFIRDVKYEIKDVVLAIEIKI